MEQINEIVESNSFIDKKKRMQSFREVVSPPKKNLEIEIPPDEFEQQQNQQEGFQQPDEESEMIRRQTEMSGFTDGT